MAEESQQTNPEEVLEAEIVNDDEPKKRNKSVLIWLAIAILLLANISSFALWYLQNSTVSQLSQQLDQTQQIAAQSTELKQLLQSESSATKAKITAIESAQKAFAENLVSIQENQKLSNAELEWKWAIAELQYLLTVANQRLLLAKDLEGAQYALRLADQHAAAMDDYRLHSLRALLAEEQLALAAVTKVDIEGLVLKLQSALNKVDDLQIWMGPAVNLDQTVEGESDVPVSDDWQQAANTMWKEVKSLVVIRHKDDAATAVLVPEQRYFLYQNLRLQMETARFALLSGEKTAFDSSVKAATDWLEQYFVGEERDAMLTLLHELQQENIEVALPDISSSLTWLKLQGDEQ